jgi:FAD/FMN-containing dehydrogenase
MGSDEAADGERFERVLAAAMDDGLVQDAVLAKSKAEAGKIWALRDDVPQLIRNYPIFTFDISLRIADMESYVAEVRARLLARWPKATLVVFGHLGDGNLHVVVGVGDSTAKHDVEEIVYQGLGTRNGSVSAEHGIGLQKLGWLSFSRSSAELAVMRAMKTALDPKGILNRGKVLEMN